MNTAQGQFSGMLVVELASVLAGPSVGMFFAEHGATVVKVENHLLGGDVTRTWKLPGEISPPSLSAYFSSVNWGKQSIGIDLKTNEGREIVYDLIRRADVVLTSYKQGDAKRLGMDDVTLRGLNPALIYAAITAYGENDPRTGFDAIIQAEAGFMFMNGTPGSGPVKMPVALMDLLAAHQLKEGVLLALLRRAKTGEGATVSVSLLEAAVASLANQAANYLVAGKIPSRMGSGHPNIVPYGSNYETADGRHLVLAVGNDKQFAGLCECLGFPEIAMQEEFRTNENRVKNREAIESRIAAAIRGQELKPLLKKFLSLQVPAGAVLNMQEVFEQPIAKSMLLSEEGLTGVRTWAGTGTPRLPLSAPPAFCAHSEMVLANLLEYNSDKIKKLISTGIVRSHG